MSKANQTHWIMKKGMIAEGGYTESKRGSVEMGVRKERVMRVNILKKRHYMQG